VFVRSGATWSLQAELTVADAAADDQLGTSVALAGDTAVVGAVNAGPTHTGAAYVFVRSGTTWTQQAFLKSSNTGPNDWFGSRAALSGDGNTAALGASLEDSSGKGINGKQDDDAAPESGAVYVFTRTGTTWSQQYYVKSSNAEAYDEFGGSVALSRDGRTMIASAHAEDGGSKGVGGNQADNSVMESGAVYVFGY
jgi:hypothetical protein